ncbi:MAG: radical SAM protein [Negativicutes bacterium]|jgi:pyruvate formate lyase activating enzyme
MYSDDVKGLVFNIQRYSLHDGNGIRTTVFMKGCPLRCPWCCNPESLLPQPELMKDEEYCLHCVVCSRDDEICPGNALLLQGRWWSVSQLVDELQKDYLFFLTSGGGVTFSGGEVLLQCEFVTAALQALVNLGVHAAIETSGIGDWQRLDALTNFCGLVMYDLKIMDDEVSRVTLGTGSRIVKDNFRRLLQKKIKVIPRVPLIPGYTALPQNLQEIAEFVSECGLNEVDLLPFHQYGRKKYQRLNKEYKLTEQLPFSTLEIDVVKKLFESYGLSVRIGG